MVKIRSLAGIQTKIDVQDEFLLPKRPTVKENFTHIWTLHPNLGFFGKVKRCVKFYRQYCIGKAQESRFCEEELRSRLDWAMESLQSDRAKLVREYGTGSREKGSKEQGLMKQIFFGYFCH
jgi:hypothetical protein